MVAFDCCGTAAPPLTRQVEIVGALAANVSLADMFLLRWLVRRGRAWAPWLSGRGFDSRRVLQLSCISHHSPATGTANSLHHY
jgi:hypothetical protein